MYKYALPLLLCSQLAYAQQVPTPPAPPARGPALDVSLDAAQVAIQECRQKEQKVSVAIVDSAGVLKVLLASDGAHARGVSSSQTKAQTALKFKAKTGDLGEQAKANPQFAEQFANNSNYNIRAGGVPLLVGDELIGAIGVGGARGSENDEACALAGIRAVQARLK